MDNYEWLTENFHSEKETVATSHVGYHTAVEAAVLRSDLLYLQVLTPCQLLDSTTQLSERENREKEEMGLSVQAVVSAFPSSLYLHFDFIFVPFYFWSRVTVGQTLQGQMSVNWNC